MPAEDVARLLAFAREQGVAFTVVGPDNPLALGIVGPQLLVHVAYLTLMGLGGLVVVARRLHKLLLK